MRARRGSAMVVAGLVSLGGAMPVVPDEPPGPALTDLDLTAANRRPPVDGLYDWSKAGYRAGARLPTEAELTSDTDCLLRPETLASKYDVIPDDEGDDRAGIQRAIDHVRAECSPKAGYTKLSRIRLPAGRLLVDAQIRVDADYLVLTGAGSDPATGTRIVYTPNADTRYDALTAGNADWDEDGMVWGSAKGGWIWPGRSLFAVASREVAARYRADAPRPEPQNYDNAPANRRDLFEGTVNAHWVSGATLRAMPGETAYAGRKGQTKVYLNTGTTGAIMGGFKVGGHVNIRAANSVRFYGEMSVPADHASLQNLHMRQQIFGITEVDTTGKVITLDKPLEFDVPVDSTSDGSPMIDGRVYTSKAAPLIDPVVGVGIENLYLTQTAPKGKTAKDAVHDYGNLDPAGQMHGIVLKGAVNDWVRGVRSDMTGSHPIVTEEAKNLSIVDNTLAGSWNKGAGGNGYFRGSRVWDSVYAGNTTRNLRHFTFQWSASGNVAIGNSFDSDLNLHGGWERHNLFELNNVTVPYEHRPGRCSVNCGEEGGGKPGDGTWYPIYWSAGAKAVKWSGSSGPDNVFFRNALRKQVDGPNAPYVDYYAARQKIHRFGVDGSGAWHHLDVDGKPISDWLDNERHDYTGGHGVDDTATSEYPSLFLSALPKR
ncbi:hypothetical protein BZB76_5490 [Actinomadura pelletieri DSM 43383]|uniref:Parallel beta helix pectate lyase-like protein n=1 Tax=Actinomadura pelletieri DSM 43383 TaxID=1120940 RepID=A0A495QGH3_9ACTN|nr:hypothetical protein [Actinomadura pelletieri]RKS71010.1 hypothetical protein BZB76_5490 [Actinomadura pelletieri DSM 43383]